MSSHDVRSAERPAPDRLLTEIADYVLRRSRRRAPKLGASRAIASWTRSAAAFWRSAFPRARSCSGPVVPGRDAARRRARAGHALRARSRRGGVQHRRADPLARLQRHVARGGVGPSVGQPRRDPRRRRLSRAAAARALTMARRADGDDPGARDPGRARAGNSFNRVGLDHVLARAHRVHGRRDAPARRQPRRDRERRLERLARRRRPADLSPRAEHRLAQELGRRRCDEPRRAARAVRARRRDGLSVGA